MPHIVTQDGTRLYYEDLPAKESGAAEETLLVIHGLGSSHYDLAEFINDLNQDYRVVFYDQRGHADSDRARMHLNVRTLGQDLNDVVEQLGLDGVTAVGHSMGAAAIFSYVGQYGTGRLRRIVAADMSPYLRNDGWKGGIGRGEWTDEDFHRDLDRLFDDGGYGSWYIAKTLMNPKLQNLPADQEEEAIEAMRESVDPLSFAALWYSLFRTDQRPVMDRIDVPFLYLMPEIPLYSTVNTDYIRAHVTGGFTLADDFPDTTHLMLSEAPHEAAARVRAFVVGD
ncbi:alpha/beta hydrolase [Actinomyces sp. 594]|uniref:alpha/beta fold hydrolase n=1 Tax=Actinomyces sp. 594 TaxID=2057793 RepID=UPI001C5895F9|nr:alpha/beta hydrolase [Actinomyces sp. 594]MBW3068070.1 alpha/beta hydrolase [Actinomyces sp. 594]